MRVLKSKKSKVAVATAAILALGGTAAYAYWSSTGDGVGAGLTGTNSSFVVTSSGAVGGPLTPGGATQTIAFTVTNPGTAGNQILTSVTVAVAGPLGVLWAPGVACSAADYTVSVTTAPTFGTLAPGASVGGVATLTMINRDADQNACKTLAVPLYFHAL